MGKPHCANHFNLDLPNPLETSLQEQTLKGQPVRRLLCSQSLAQQHPTTAVADTATRAAGDRRPAILRCLERAPRRNWEEAKASLEAALCPEPLGQSFLSI